MFWQIVGIIIIGIGTGFPYLRKEENKIPKKYFIWTGIAIVVIGMTVMANDSYRSEKIYKSEIGYLVQINKIRTEEDSLRKVSVNKNLKENLINEININIENIKLYQEVQDKIDKDKFIIRINLNYEFMIKYVNEVNDTLLDKKLQNLISYSKFTNDYLHDVNDQTPDAARTNNIYGLDSLIQYNKVLNIEILELLHN